MPKSNSYELTYDDTVISSRHEIVKTDSDLPVRFFYSNDGRRSYVIPHFHDDIEIMYLLTGTLTLTNNMEEIHLQPGDISVINPNIIHSTLSENSETTAYVLQIPYAFLKKCCPDPDAFYFEIPLYSKFQMSEIQEKQLNHIKDLLLEFYILYTNMPEFYYIKLQSVLYEIVYILFGTFSKSQHTKRHTNEYKYFQRLSKVTTYIKENYAETIALDEMADLISVTPAYLSRFFKKTLKMTFTEYISLIRLEHAYTDLITTNYPVLYISEKNGFANYQIFVQKFKNKYGRTPLILRKENR